MGSPNEHVSVLTERPTDHRQPMDITVLWYAMALGVAILIAAGIAHWLRPKVRGGESNGSDPKI